ncbi:hypothetical protein CCMSSC00406_0007107 [Pleurotus cornucopiae]|uniref:Uncharacterized protein n=1 Tax=Pleurotus cornucopiae TaxID=5321 RepID=A0ACB7IRQ2_PLECO|nr:hypothetical protein CCMSSC00406_0007107 [Pleurotus cornucopiae]
MTTEIVGSLPVKHNVDPNGSLGIDVPLMLPPAKMAPNLTVSYHSAANNASVIGVGWTIKGASYIERVPATIAQDQLRGSVNYDQNDRFALDGQRLISIGNNEYRYELETWSKVVARGSDASNPDSWVEYLPDGTQRTFGNTSDSNIKAAGGNGTRVWAVTQNIDPFKNYVSYSYINDTANGAFYLDQVNYGGNQAVSMAHQRNVKFTYADRPDTKVRYLGGYKIAMLKRLSAVTSSINNAVVHTHVLNYDSAPLSGVSRLNSISIRDASGNQVRPVKFNWVDSNPAIFGDLKAPTTINPQDPDAQVMPMDVHATGRTDLVVSSKRFQGSQKLHLDVYRSDANGVIASTPESTLDGIDYPTQLLPLDFNGDGRNDLLHITTSMSSHTLTVLLSTPSGYQAQTPLSFTPEYIGGSFHIGDFEANGRVGLCYIYQVWKNGGPQLRFIQFVSDGQKFTALPPQDGPTGVSFSSIKVVVGDLNGDHAEDVFIMYSAFKNGGNKVQIELLQSDSNGRLQYRSDKPLLSVAESIYWTNNINFLPYSADEDGKTSLLVVSPDINSNLQLQMIRSSGPTLLPPSSPIATSIAYNGNVTLAKTSSTTAIDLVNTFNKQFASPPQTEVTVMRFFNDTFTILSNVKQPGVTSSFVTWADLRGIGRSDCLLGTADHTGTITIKPMPSSASQPPDFISGYENGLGAKLSVSYSSLSDPNTYTTDSTDTSGSPVVAVNAMARNVSFTANLSSSSVSQSSAHTRSQIVYFPSYVVKQLKHTPYAARPDIVDESDYTYKTARYGFDGRGWLGFETITKTAPSLGSSTATNYHQQFPLINQQKQIRVTDTPSSKVLQVTDNTWQATPGNNNKNQFVSLSKVKESNYEGGSIAYEVNVDYAHDNYGNVTSMTTQVPQTGAPALTITCTFNNDTAAWVLGQKTLEKVTSGSTILRQTKRNFHPGSLIATEQSQWAADDTWSTQSFEFDSTGNETTVKGPGQALRKFTYDSTSTNLASSSVYTSADNILTETAVFDLVSGKPLSTTTPNGDTTAIVYDVLGRATQISIGSQESGMKVIEKQAYETDGTNFYHIEYTDSDDSGQDVWFKVINHLDGMSRVWRREVPRPDDPNTMTYSDVEYDGAGRIVKRARDYVAGTSPAYATFQYDSLSRLTNQSLPPAASDVASISSTFTYSFVAGIMHAKETRSDGQGSNTVATTREITYLPNPEPSATKLTKSFVTASVNELNQPVKTVFDGLGRPISISDPSGNTLLLGWDGLDRAITRQISNSDGGAAKDIQKTSATYEDDLGKVTIKNELTGTSSVVQSDWANRPLSKVTAEDSFTFVYDTGGKYTKENLVSVTSTKGIGYKFDYDQRGNLTSSVLTIDSQDYPSSYKWSTSRELLQTTNPDGTVMTRTMYSDGATVKRVELTDTSKAVRAWINLSDYNDVVNRPLVCEFGNGITSTSKLADNGSLVDMSLAKGGSMIHQQSWKIDSFSRINRYDSIRGGQGLQAQASSSQTFTYDDAGQLSGRVPDAGSATGNAESYAYDNCGNIQSKGGKTFVNKGWQLDQIKDTNTGATQFTFQYSVDGHLTSKVDGTGKETASMQYDSEGHLIALNKTSFVYDYGGRLVKAVLPNGDIRIYPSHTYEVDIAASGDKAHSAYLIHGYRRAALSTSATSSSVNYFHTDHLGSTIAISDVNGGIITEYSYDSFGQATVTSGDDVSRYKFSGKEMFDGIYYFGSRFYDPDTGRFLTLDSYPVDVQNATPSTFNMYSFSRNDPMNFIDLNGNVPWWHWLVDAVLIAVGVALLFVPGVNAIVVGVMAVVTGALIGGGLAGAMYDVKAQISGKSDDKAWGMAVGLGALFGGISGGLSAGVDALLPAVTFIDISSNMGAIGARMVAGWVVKTVARVAIKTAVDTGLGVLKQMSANGIEGKRWDEGLGDAAASSALSGFASAAKGEAVAFLKPIKGSGLRLKFWKNRNWKVYRVADAEKMSGLGKLAKSPEYPISSSEPKLLSYRSLSEFGDSFAAPSSSRFIPVGHISGL